MIQSDLVTCEADRTSHTIILSQMLNVITHVPPSLQTSQKQSNFRFKSDLSYVRGGREEGGREGVGEIREVEWEGRDEGSVFSGHEGNYRDER